MIGGLTKSASRFAVMAAAGMFAGGIAMSSANAADLGGDCCADLEERVAELEATTARKGNRVMSLTVSGQVNRSIMYWDDGDYADTYIAGNENSGSRFRFLGSAKMGGGWSAGYMLEIDYGDAHNNTLTQFNSAGNSGFGVRHDFVWIKSDTLGKIYLGQTSRASDGALQVDLSGASVVAYEGVADWNAGFFLRRSDRANNLGVTRVTWGAVVGSLDSSRSDIIRYDTPTIAGFTASASWGEDDIWDVALRFANEFAGIRIAAAIAYREETGREASTRVGAQLLTNAEIDQNVTTGSISLMHVATGLNINVSYGQREHNAVHVNLGSNGPVTGKGADTIETFYVKGGIYNKFFAPGKTAIYGEYGVWKDFLSHNASSAANLADLEAVAGTAAEITGSETTVWGLGIVQKIDAAAMELFAGYRHYETSVDLIGAGGASVATAPLEDFDAILAGARIKF